MIQYHIFLVEDEVYYDYFFKTGLLNRFFIAYLADPTRFDFKKQFNYITCPIPYHEIDQTQQTVDLNDRMITVFSDEQLILDNQFLTQLEQIDHHCFIVDHINNNYGWLTPKKIQLHWTNQTDLYAIEKMINQSIN